VSEMTAEKAAELRKPFPRSAIGKLPKGGTMLDYVGHAAVSDRLLAVDPAWSWEPFTTDERGLPALAIFLWFIVSLGLGLVRLIRGSSDRLLPATGLAALSAMLAAGLFEYNFGDSEFLMLFLVLITLPFAALSRAERPA